MNSSSTSRAQKSNRTNDLWGGRLAAAPDAVLRAIFILLCLTLAACGTKPKQLKGQEPFPVAYPDPQTQGLPPTPPPTKPDQTQ